MAAPLDLDPSSSVLAYFGSELRRYRSAAELSQERLGEIVNYTGALIGIIETAKRTPTRDFAERCDAALNAEGALIRLWPLVNRSNLPSWFRGFVELEATATSIQSFDVHVVPGILQTEDYARGVLQAAKHPAVDEAVVARLDRQRILSRPTPPLLWAVLDEGVLRRCIGGPTVLRTQLKQLIEAASSSRIVVQVLPYDATVHAGLDGPLTLLSFDEGPDSAYVERLGSSLLMTRPEEVERCRLVYDLVRAAALSPEASVDVITSRMEEL